MGRTRIGAKVLVGLSLLALPMLGIAGGVGATASASASVAWAPHVPFTCLPHCPPVEGSAYGYLQNNFGDVILGGYNSRGLTDTVTNPATGQYLVNLPGLTAAGGTANVSTYPGENCTVASWSADQVTGTTLDIRCFVYLSENTPNWAPWNGDFSFTFTSETTTVGVGLSYGYALVSDAADATSTPSDQFDGWGGTVKVHHLGTGLYAVKFPNLGYGAGGSASVAPYTSAATSCEVESLSGPSATETVTLKCLDLNSGAPADTEFAITYLRNNNLLDQNGPGWAFADEAAPLKATGTFVPTFSGNSTTGSVTVTRVSVGSYEVNVQGFSNAADAQVTTFGTGKNSCMTANSPYSEFGVEEIYVQCNKAFGTGAYVDAPFMVQLTD